MPPLPKRPEDRIRRNKPKEISQRTGDVPEPPANLSEELENEWINWWSSAAASLVDDDSDYKTVCRLFGIYGLIDAAFESMESEGLNPQKAGLVVRLSAEARMLENALGCSPRSRAALGVVTGDSEGSLDDYL